MSLPSYTVTNAEEPKVQWGFKDNKSPAQAGK